ncbi:hypothetical protein [Nocardia nepalensis]|uniref:hypothetical protein n=1 Tax=Nocardia nepalensis TaxID=3375448 RepID=UPI003B67BC48
MTTYSDKIAAADIEFEERIPEDRRWEIWNSINALVTRRIAENVRRRERAAEDRFLADGLQEPLLDQVRASARGADALRLAAERARTGTLDVSELPTVSAQDPTQHVSVGMLDYPFATNRDFEGPATRIFSIPYDFSWSWHDQHGSAPFNQIITRSSGRAALDARVGNAPGATGSFVATHAGYGVSLRSDHRVACMARSLRSTHDVGAASVGLNADATVEAGCEMTVMQNGHLVTIAVDKRFRGRISGSVGHPTENYNYDNGGFGTGETIEVLWTMEADTNYELNVGAWVFAETQHGIGGAGAQSLIDAKIILMSLWQ